MRFVKGFTTDSAGRLGEIINAWLEEHEVKLVDLKFTSIGYEEGGFEHETHSALVIYEAYAPEAYAPIE
jgi:hypothetical protein